MRWPHLELLVDRWNNADRAMKIVAAAARRNGKSEKREKAFVEARTMRQEAERDLIDKLAEGTPR